MTILGKVLDALLNLINKLIDLIDALISQGNDKSEFKGEFMYIVKADNPDVGFTVAYDTFDSEGNPIPEDNMNVEVVSDNESVVAVSFDDASDSGSVSFGSPGVANINATVMSLDGTLLGSFGAQFTVTVGDPASIAGGTIAFEGLEEVPETPTEPQPPIEEPAPEPTEPEVPVEPTEDENL